MPIIEQGEYLAYELPKWNKSDKPIHKVFFWMGGYITPAHVHKAHTQETMMLSDGAMHTRKIKKKNVPNTLWMNGESYVPALSSVRIIPKEDQQRLRDYDNEIKRLQMERRKFYKDSFIEWPLATEENFEVKSIEECWDKGNH